MEERIITADLIKGFAMHLIEDEKSSATIEKYLRDVRTFYHYAKGSVIDKHTVLKYKEHIGGSYAVSSANSMLAAVNVFLDFMGRHECRVKPFRMQKAAYCSEEKDLTREEYFRLVKAAARKGDERLKLIIQTICGTGIRVSELEHITAEAVRNGEAVVQCKGKTRKVFIVKALRKNLMEYVRKRGITSGPVFVTRTGRPVSRCNIWRQMKNLCRTADVAASKIFPHNLRHLFAKVFYSMEKDIVKLADILGHASINTTRIYTVTTGVEHRMKMERMRLIL